VFWDGRSGPKLVRSFAVCPGMRNVRDHNIADESKSMRTARSHSCRNIAFLPSQHECLLRALRLGSASQHLSIPPLSPRAPEKPSTFSQHSHRNHPRGNDGSHNPHFQPHPHPSRGHQRSRKRNRAHAPSRSRTNSLAIFNVLIDNTLDSGILIAEIGPHLRRQSGVPGFRTRVRGSWVEMVGVEDAVDTAAGGCGCSYGFEGVDVDCDGGVLGGW